MAQYGGNNYNGGGGGGGYGANPYAQQNRYAQQDTGYGGQPNPYAQQNAPNPYAQQNAPNNYGQQGGYAAGNDMEMGHMNGGESILDRCNKVRTAINAMKQDIQSLRELQRRALESSQPGSDRAVDQKNSEIIAINRELANKIKNIKQTPGSANPDNARHINSVSGLLQQTFEEYRRVENEFDQAFRAQVARQYMIVNPNASEQEARQAAENPSGGVFSQALLQSDRRGQAQSTLRAVQSRHEEIQKIQQQMEQLAQLFTEMNQLVLQQEPTVTRIAEQSENVQTDVTNANVQLDGAIEKAKARNRKKWWCLGIGILILIIVVIIVVIVVEVNKH